MWFICQISLYWKKTNFPLRTDHLWIASCLEVGLLPTCPSSSWDFCLDFAWVGLVLPVSLREFACASSHCVWKSPLALTLFLSLLLYRSLLSEGRNVIFRLPVLDWALQFLTLYMFSNCVYPIYCICVENLSDALTNGSSCMPFGAFLCDIPLCYAVFFRFSLEAHDLSSSSWPYKQCQVWFTCHAGGFKSN